VIPHLRGRKSEVIFILSSTKCLDSSIGKKAIKAAAGVEMIDGIGETHRRVGEVVPTTKADVTKRLVGSSPADLPLAKRWGPRVTCHVLERDGC
jgi:hypothetical protein